VDDNLLCLHCIEQLPHTHFAFHRDNPTEKIFHGRLDLIAAMSEFYFAKGTLIQDLIHEFKYNGKIEIGIYLGKMIGESILAGDHFYDVECLVPLPLFAEKEFKRGYNQATILCKGISEVTGIPVINNNVVRKRPTETQTKKHRIERWQNVEGSFDVVNEQELKGKHVLLVDDVVTTGATLEACGSRIMQIKGTRLSIATLAIASK